MKKVFILIVCVLMAVCAALPATADEADTVCVTVIDGSGNAVAVCEKVLLFDGMTVNDALYALHEMKYPGGAAAGYTSAESEYGISLLRLWGDESGAFGYCVNDVPCLSLADTVASGNTVTAYVYTDQENWSDVYAYFDKKELTVQAGEAFTLTLCDVVYDETWTPSAAPVAGADVFAGKEKIGVTDENGRAVLTLNNAGSFVLTAESGSVNLVTPVCRVTVEGAAADFPWLWIVIAAVVVIAAAVAAVVVKNAKNK